MARRSHTSILSWFRSLSFLFVDGSLKGKVRLLLIDDTRVEVGGREQVLFVAFEPRLRRIVCMRLFEAANTLTALTFMKKIKAIYRSRMKVLTDGAQYYRTACKFLSLDHDVYDLRLGNVMERIVQHVKDRARDFCFVVGRGKRSIEDHFTPDWGFVKLLRDRGKSALARELESFYEMVESSRILFVNQPEPKGFGHAVLMARPFVGDGPFVVCAGDTYVVSEDNGFLRRMCEAFSVDVSTSSYCRRPSSLAT
jgi:hypothetical protein